MCPSRMRVEKYADLYLLLLSLGRITKQVDDQLILFCDSTLAAHLSSKSSCQLCSWPVILLFK